MVAFARCFAKAPERLAAKAAMTARLHAKIRISLAQCVTQLDRHVGDIRFLATIWLPAVTGLAPREVALVVHFVHKAAFVVGCWHCRALRTWARGHWARWRRRG